MSSDRLRQIADRLTEIAAALGQDSVDDARVLELAEEAAGLTEEAVGQTEAEVAKVESQE